MWCLVMTNADRRTHLFLTNADRRMAKDSNAMAERDNMVRAPCYKVNKGLEHIDAGDTKD